MKQAKKCRRIVLSLAIGLLSSGTALAGNPDKPSSFDPSEFRHSARWKSGQAE